MAKKQKDEIFVLGTENFNKLLFSILWTLLERLGWFKRSDDGTGSQPTDKGIEKLRNILVKLPEDNVYRVYENAILNVKDPDEQDVALLTNIVREKFIMLGWLEPPQRRSRHIFTDKGIDRVKRIAKKLSKENVHNVLRNIK